MKKLGLFFFMLPVFSLGQEIRFDFEDQDLADWYQSSEDHWKVLTDNPIEGSYSLMHSYDSDEAGTDWITFFHLPLTLSDAETVWQFSLRYDFNPSSNNNWAVLLGTDCLPKKNLRVENALILGVNYEGNDDILKLWEITDGETHFILNSKFNWEEYIDKKQIVDFRLTISPEQEIEIEIDTSGKEFVLLDRGELKWNKRINNFGFLYKYTSTYDRGLTVDNISVSGKMEVDNEAPIIEGVHILNQKVIEIRFSEMIKTTVGSKWCLEGIGCNSLDISVHKNVLLTLPEAMIPGNHYTLALENVIDLYGNKLNENKNHTYYYPASYDVVINEIMADPGPPILLPEVEYIELYNRSKEIISIENWQLSVNSKSFRIPSVNLLSGEYIVLCNEKDTGLFTENIKLAPIQSMRAINNNGAEIILQDISGKLIHAVQYSNKWIKDLDKKEGGWSVEMIDPENPCNPSENWIASIDFQGGTPGKENSVYSPLINQSDPEVWRTAVTEIGSLKVYFSEPLDSLKGANSSYYSVNQSIGSPEIMELSWPLADKMELIFTDHFEKEKEYTLSITRDPCNCNGRSISELKNNLFMVPMAYDSSDVIMNEIMFEPVNDCIEYIELFNRSDKTIEIKDWQLQVGEKSVKTLTSEYFPLLPGSYAIVASGIKGIDNPDRFKTAQQIINMPEMPTLSNDGELIRIMDNEGNTIDMALYDPSWHHELYTDTQGKSLERISPARSGLDRDNWQSASSAAGFQTPGAINSQSEQPENANQLTVLPETITPNADGVDDELNICYRLDGSDYMTRVLVYDINGRLRKTIANGSIPGTGCCYTFDGKGENGSILPTGYYVLYFEAYDQYGKRFREKVSFVIAVE